MAPPWRSCSDAKTGIDVLADSARHFRLYGTKDRTASGLMPGFLFMRADFPIDEGGFRLLLTVGSPSAIMDSMVTFDVLGMLVFYGISIMAALLALRDPRRVRRLHSAVWSAGAFTIGSLFLVLFLFTYEGDPETSAIAGITDTLTIAAAALVGAGIIAWVLFIRARHRAAPKSAAPPGVALAHHHQTLRERIQIAARIAGPDWESVDTPTLAAEEAEEASRTNLLLVAGAFVILIPGILLLLATSIFINVRGSTASDFAAKTLGYYILLVATSWTIIYVVTIAFVAVQQVLREQGRDLSISKMTVTVGTWAGMGAAGGVFVGALIPVIVLIIPRGPFEFMDITLLDSISPSLLLDISAAGAVFGFLVGEIISLVDLADGEENLFVKTVLPPFVFGVAATVLGIAGLRPGALSSQLAREYQQGVLAGIAKPLDPLTTGIDGDLETPQGWAELIVSFDHHGWNNLVDTNFYFWGTWSVVILVIIFSFTLQVHKRELQLAKLAA